MSHTEREAIRVRLLRLGKEWDSRLRKEWLDGRPAAAIAHHYGLEPATLDAVLAAQITKRKAA
jgi:hypothetical protein